MKISLLRKIHDFIKEHPGLEASDIQNYFSEHHNIEPYAVIIGICTIEKLGGLICQYTENSITYFSCDKPWISK